MMQDKFVSNKDFVQDAVLEGHRVGLVVKREESVESRHGYRKGQDAKGLNGDGAD